MADIRLASLKVLMKEMDLSVGTFEERLLLQKTIYLAQLFGLDLKYRFNWYMHGPYSPALTADAYDSSSAGDQVDVAIAHSHAKRLELLKRLVSTHPRDIAEAQWAELLSSIHYLKHITFPSREINATNAETVLREAGKEFSGSAVKEAWLALDRAGLITNKSLAQPS